MSTLLHLSGTDWKLSYLGEQALLLEPVEEEPAPHLQSIHTAARMLEKAEIPGLTDVIPAYQSIALIYDRLLSDPEDEVHQIEKNIQSSGGFSFNPQQYRVPVCYEMGLDLEELQRHTGMGRDEIIDLHLKGSYTLAMIGFIPGFLYLDGLDPKLAIPRRDKPRTNIPAGSVGIGGSQAGIYSLESPGGWQIIGRTPHTFFNPDSIPPVQLKPGDSIQFERISEADFRKHQKEAGL